MHRQRRAPTTGACSVWRALVEAVSTNARRPRSGALSTLTTPSSDRRTTHKLPRLVGTAPGGTRVQRYALSLLDDGCVPKAQRGVRGQVSARHDPGHRAWGSDAQRGAHHAGDLCGGVCGGLVRGGRGRKVKPACRTGLLLDSIGTTPYRQRQLAAKIGGNAIEYVTQLLTFRLIAALAVSNTSSTNV